MTKLKNVCSYANVMGKKAKGIGVLIEDAIKSKKTMQERVQQAAIGVLFHAEEHGDYSYAQVLVDGLGNGINSRALVEFFVKYGGLVVDEEESGFSGWAGAEYIRKNFAQAKATPWWELKKKNPYAGFNLLDELAKVVKKAGNANSKLEKAGSDNDLDAFEELEGKINTEGLVELNELIAALKKAA